MTHRPAALLLRMAAWVMPPGRQEWSAAMRAELEVVPTGRAGLGFAAGCVGVALRERAGFRAVPTGLRLLGLGLVAVSAAQALTESGQWLNGNPSSRHAYLGVVGAVLVLATCAVLRLTAAAAQVAPSALVGGSVAGGLAVAGWAAYAVLPTTLPRDAAVLVFLALGAGAVAGVLVATVTNARQGWLAGVVAAATTSGLGLAVAELLIQHSPTRIPDIVGPFMPGGSTAAQVWRENRIEIVDGYVPLLFLGALLSCLAVALTFVARERHDAPEARELLGGGA